MNVQDRLALAHKLQVELTAGALLKIPDGVSRIKFDVGLSFSAPHLISWITEDPELFVVGIEPIEENIESVRNLVQALGKSFYERVALLRAAAGSVPGDAKFYVTFDKGQASLQHPIEHEVQREDVVVVETIDRIATLIPWDKFSRLDFLKTDCQGGDLDALLGARETLVRTAVVTFEEPTTAYEQADDTISPHIFLANLGFNQVNKRSPMVPRIRGGVGRVLASSELPRRIVHWLATRRSQKHGPGILTLDPTFVNEKFSEQVKRGEITAHQFN